ncbi:MAG: cytochrome C peroxidase, partial [Solirubrobacterales bacterium]|nr:cytochrome C peroxidase [Solirubrobacterales bacterium]
MLLLSAALVGAQAPPAHAADPALAPLSTVPVPVPADIARYIRDDIAAIRLGKSLFWDMQAGSDGRTACATCHFNAGADARSQNQIGPRGPSFDFKGPNATLTASDFPLHKLSDPDDAASAVISDTDDVVGSQGVFPSKFVDVFDGDPVDGQSFGPPDPQFSIGGHDVRRVTKRHTPSTINAVFNFRQFWDGRAQNDFNGVTPFGSRDPDARVGRVRPDGGVDKVAINVTDASLASQAVSPPVNPTEMSADGRSLSDVGRKLLALRPLGTQAVSPTDSVLGADADASGLGLSISYGDLIRSAFKPEWWDSAARVSGPGNREYSLMQFNFSLFWGLAIQAYEATLVSDQAPIDQFLAGDRTALSDQAQEGMGVFTGKGACSKCHGGAVFTNATTQDIRADGPTDRSGGEHDRGFENIGVRPDADDPGNGDKDPFGKPLSITRLTGQGPDGVEGTFKVSGLRNVELTAPYFHNGGQSTLRQVVDFYNRGGDFDNPEKSSDVKPLGLKSSDKDALVSFMESLTDPRVRDQSAPFDHPQLFVPVGERTAADGALELGADDRAVDCFRQVPATGSDGGSAVAPFLSFTGPPCDTPNPLRGVRASTPAPGG